MGVDDPDCLQIGVEDHGARKLHPAAFQIPGYGVGQRRAVPPGLDDHLSVGPVPEIPVKAAPLFLNGEKDRRIIDRRLDLSAVADDARVALQGGHLVRPVQAHRPGVEIIKGAGE